MCNAIIVLDIVLLNSKVRHSSDDNFIIPPLKYLERPKKKGPMLRSPFTQQSSSSIVEVPSHDPSVLKKGLDERVI